MPTLSKAVPNREVMEDKVEPSSGDTIQAVGGAWSGAAVRSTPAVEPPAGMTISDTTVVFPAASFRYTPIGSSGKGYPPAAVMPERS